MAAAILYLAAWLAGAPPGLPAATGCRDEVPGGWAAGGPRPTTPTPVTMYVRNTSAAPLYLPGTTAAGVFYQLSTAWPRARPLELHETTFCPVVCPDSGPPADVDCGRATPAFTPLAPRETLELRWSGEEAPEVKRRCGDSPARTCRLRRPAAAGSYVLEVCAHSAVSGGRALPAGHIVGARPTGPARCQRVVFEHPGGRVELSLR